VFKFLCPYDISFSIPVVSIGASLCWWMVSAMF
jgi:hypothetical protein